MKRYTIGFYLEKLYYIPHFKSIIQELEKRGISYTLIIPPILKRDSVNQREKATLYCEQHHYPYIYEEEDCFCDILIFGNTPHPIHSSFHKSALIMHGTWGGKKVYMNPAFNNTDIRFLDGEFMYNWLIQHFPDKKDIYYVSGYSKLDNYFKLTQEDRIQFLKERNLDPNKKTILYAPTFYPTSIRKIDKNFPLDFAEYNIIIKAHSHTFLRKKYTKDLQRIQLWDKYPNTYVANFQETDIIPFLHASDILISDISSTVFEFAGIGKPVIINQFLKYRLIDILCPWHLSKRLDTQHFNLWEVGDQARNYQEMRQFTHENLQHPDKNKKQREQLVKHVLGIVDGQVATRIVDKLMQLNDSIAQ